MAIGCTFSLTLIAWIFFRAASVDHAVAYLRRIGSTSLFSVPSFPEAMSGLGMLAVVAGFVIVEWLGRDMQYGLEAATRLRRPSMRYVCYYSIGVAILFLGRFEGSEFIYFQF